MMDIIMYVLGFKWRKKKKKAAPKKPAAKKKASSKAVVEELENDVLFCKDYVSVRWKITEEGQLATWQPEEEGRPTLSIVPGKITDVVDDKMCGLVAEEGVKKTVRTKINKKQMLACKLFFVVFFPYCTMYAKNQQKIICMSTCLHANYFLLIFNVLGYSL